MPAYYKLLEALNKENDVEALCLGKVGHDGIEIREVFRFSNLERIQFHIVPHRKTRLFGRHLGNIANEILQLFYTFKVVFRERPDVIYVDRIHIVYGAILSVFFGKKVVVRLYGVASLLKRFRGLRKWLKEPVRYLSYKAPFSHVICTKDGSGARYFIEHFMNRNIPYEILLNGVDKDIKLASQVGQMNPLRQRYGIAGDHKIILFVSRLDDRKGARRFADALCELAKKNKKFFAVVVGDGKLRKTLQEDTAKSDIKDHISFEGAVDHDAIYAYYSMADIYVSLNFLGNLCNTVLEAINAGKCIVTFKKDPLDHTDDDTEAFLAGNAVLIDKRRIMEELPNVLEGLINDDSRIRSMEEGAVRSSKMLPSWNERIEREIKLLERVGQNGQA
ncbi:glycosyltransferase family 4 protein [Elusimicrobiota bacterium]